MKLEAFKAILVLLEVKGALDVLTRATHPLPALIMAHSFIDICAHLSREGEASNAGIFKTYVAEYMVPEFPSLPFGPDELWDSRCGMMHAFTPFGRNVARGKTRPIMYFETLDQRHKLSEWAGKQGVDDPIYVGVWDLKAYAIGAFNRFHAAVRQDGRIEAHVIDNARGILARPEYHAMLAEFSAVGIHEIGS